MDVGCYQVEVQNWGWERRERRRRKKQELFKFFRNGTSHFWNPPKNANPWAVAKMASPRYFTSQVHFRILRLFVALVWGWCTCLLDVDNFFVHFSVLLLLFLRRFEVVIFVVVVFGLLLCCYCVFFMSCFESLVLGGYQLECAHFF